MKSLLASGAILIAALSGPASSLPAPAPAPAQLHESTWQAYSFLERPFENVVLRFSVLDPATGQDTKCETDLPMGDYQQCEGGQISFIFGGISFQYGEAFLNLRANETVPCTDAHTACQGRPATATVDLPDDFWQQPGWNNWVHPEPVDVNWRWTS